MLITISTPVFRRLADFVICTLSQTKLKPRNESSQTRFLAFFTFYTTDIFLQEVARKL